MRLKLNLKTKALLFLCPVIILISVVYALSTIRSEKRILRREVAKRGEILTTLAAKNAELPIISGNQELLQSVAASLKAIENVSFVTFYNPVFETIIHEGIATTTRPTSSMSPASEAVVISENVHFFDFYRPVFSIHEASDIELFEESTPNTLHKVHIGWVRIGLSKETMIETVNAIARNGALLAILMVVIAIIIVNALLNIILQPLNTLFKATKDMSDGEYPVVPHNDMTDEVGRLTAEFNKMSHAIKEREDQLIYSQKRIRDLFERVEHAIFRLDPDFKVIEGNTKFDELCEHEADFFCLIAEEKRDPLLKAAIEGQLVGTEVVIKARDGHDHIIYLSVYPETGKDGTIRGFDGHFIDITEKKKIEEVLHQTQKLESLGLLAGGIAHDFNNILTTIIGYSELVLIKLPKSDPLQTNIEAIHNAGEKAAALTRQLLAFSRKQVMEVKVFSLNTLINKMSKMLGRLIGETIEMKLMLHSPNGNIKADPGQIEQIAMNLVINARDAMPKGGSLIIETDTIYLDEEYCRSHPEVSPGSFVALTVTDSGHGMTPELREKIFDPFFTTKEKGAGTGLGLSTVYGIVKQLKGHIFIYSEIGRGTTFKIYFPESKEAAEMPAKIEGERLPMGAETLLIVDDEASIRYLLCDTLQPLGYNTIKAPDAEAALEIWKSSRVTIDLLLTDVIMPKMGGRELAKIIKTAQPGIKVLFMSGYTDEVISQQGVLEPGTHLINKPLIPTVLAKKIREILDS